MTNIKSTLDKVEPIVDKAPEENCEKEEEVYEYVYNYRYVYNYKYDHDTKAIKAKEEAMDDDDLVK